MCGRSLHLLYHVLCHHLVGPYLNLEIELGVEQTL